MKRILILLLSICSLVSYGQILQDPNTTPSTARTNEAISGSYPTTGTDNYSISPVGSYSYTYLTGKAVSITIPDTDVNTGAATLNFDGLGVKDIKKWSSGSLVDVSAGDLIGTIRLRYDGTQFVMEGGAGGSGSTQTLQEVINTGSTLTSPNTIVNGTNAQTVTTAVTSGSGTTYSSTTLTSGAIVKIQNTSTANNSPFPLYVTSSGVNANSNRTSYGLNVEVSNTGTTSDNEAIRAVASGATSNVGGVITGTGTGTANTGLLLSATGAATANTALVLTTNSGTSNTALQISTGSGDIKLGTDAGSVGDLLKSEGPNALPSWYTPTPNPMTTTGDMIVSSDGSGTPARIGIGSEGDVLTVSAGVPSWESPTVSSVSFDDLTDAAAINTVANAAYAQTWTWNSLAGQTGLSLTSNSTAAASNTQRILEVAQSGANASSGQTTYGASISNTKTGGSSTNIALALGASGADNNFALDIPTGDFRIGTSSSSAALLKGIYNTSGGGFAIRATSGSTGTFQFGFDSSGNYGGSANNVNGADFYLYDLQAGAYRMGMNASGEFHVGASSSSFGFRATQTGETLALVATGVDTDIVANSASGTHRSFKKIWIDATATSVTQDINLLNGYTDATATVVFTVVGVKSDGSESTGAQYASTFNKDGATTVVEVGSETQIYHHETDAATTVTISVASNLIRVVVDSGDDDSYRWTVFADITITQL